MFKRTFNLKKITVLVLLAALFSFLPLYALNGSCDWSGKDAWKAAQTAAGNDGTAANPYTVTNEDELNYAIRLSDRSKGSASWTKSNPCHIEVQNDFEISYKHNAANKNDDDGTSGTGKTFRLFSPEGSCYTISRKAGYTDGFFAIANGSSYLYLKNIILDGGYDWAKQTGTKATVAGPFISNGNGYFYLEDGCVLQNSYTSKRGGACNVNGSTQCQGFMYDGAVIRSCHSDDYGGAVGVYRATSDSTSATQPNSFTMEGGTIEYCSAKHGGAISVQKPNLAVNTKGTTYAEIKGGLIEHCFVAGGSGGAICVNHSSQTSTPYTAYNEATTPYVTISGGTIRNCLAAKEAQKTAVFPTTDFDGNGGTIYVTSAGNGSNAGDTYSKSLLNISGGSLYVGKGGNGILTGLYGKAVCNITGGKFINNSSSGSGYPFYSTHNVEIHISGGDFTSTKDQYFFNLNNVGNSLYLGGDINITYPANATKALIIVIDPSGSKEAYIEVESPLTSVVTTRINGTIHLKNSSCNPAYIIDSVGSKYAQIQQDGTAKLVAASEASINGKNYANIYAAWYFAKSGDTIKLNADVVNPIEFALDSKNLTVDGQDHTITLTDGSHRLFKLTGTSELNVSHLVVDGTGVVFTIPGVFAHLKDTASISIGEDTVIQNIDAGSQSGAVIYLIKNTEASLYANGLTVNNCKTTTNGVIYAGSTKTVTLENSNFNNVSAARGVVINKQAINGDGTVDIVANNVNVNGSIGSNSSAGVGGVYYVVNGGIVQLNGGNYKNLEHAYRAGLVGLDIGTIYVNDVHVDTNIAKGGYGGLFFMGNAADIYISNSSFKNCSLEKNCGAVIGCSSGWDGNLFIGGTTSFENCSSPDSGTTGGGAVYTNTKAGSCITIDGSKTLDPNDGWKIKDIDIENDPHGITFKDCSAYRGGAMCLIDDGKGVSPTIFLNDITFEDCSSTGTNGGAIAVSCGFATKDQSVVNTLSNLRFVNCVSANNGGAVHYTENAASPNKLKFENLVFENCVGTLDGGAFYLTLNKTPVVPVLLNNLSFTNCRTERYGGAICVAGKLAPANERAYFNGLYVTNNEEFPADTPNAQKGGAVFFDAISDINAVLSKGSISNMKTYYTGASTSLDEMVYGAAVFAYMSGSNGSDIEVKTTGNDTFVFANNDHDITMTSATQHLCVAGNVTIPSALVRNAGAATANLYIDGDLTGSIGAMYYLKDVPSGETVYKFLESAEDDRAIGLNLARVNNDADVEDFTLYILPPDETQEGKILVPDTSKRSEAHFVKALVGKTNPVTVLVIPKAEEASVSLETTVPLNFYLQLQGGTKPTYTVNKVVYNWATRSYTTQEVTVEVEPQVDSNKATAMLTFPVTPLMLGEKFTINYKDYEGNDASQEYSVEEYCNSVLDNTDAEADLKDVCQTLLNYGKGAVDYFYRNSQLKPNTAQRATEPSEDALNAENYPADCTTTWTDIYKSYDADGNLVNSDFVLDFDKGAMCGTSLVCSDAMKVVHYFYYYGDVSKLKVKTGSGFVDATIMSVNDFNGVQGEYDEHAYVLVVSDIPAAKISETYKVGVYVEGTLIEHVFEFNPLNYCLKVCMNPAKFGVKLANLCRSIFDYSKAAKTYFGK